MKALQLVDPTVLEIVDIEVPAVGPDEVLLKVGGAGLCHSDIHVRRFPTEVFPLPLTLGHEVAGTVESIGARVSGWAPGDAAVVHLVWACGKCRFCARGDDNVCAAAGRLAQPPAPGLGPAGGMAEYMTSPARYLVPIGDLDPVSAAPLADAGMTSYHAIRNSRTALRPDATAAVIGVGGLGHVAVQLLRELTACQVVAVDAAPDRREAAAALGADITVAGTEATALILEVTDGRGAEAVFDFVGTQSTTDVAVATVAPDGIYQLVGMGGGRPAVSADPRFGTGWPYGAALRTSYGGTRSDLIECVALAQKGRITVDIERFDLSDGINAFDRLEAGGISGRAVLVP